MWPTIWTSPPYPMAEVIKVGITGAGPRFPDLAQALQIAQIANGAQRYGSALRFQGCWNRNETVG